ncbi:NAD(P)/FAD-dependent oxidoreductase [Asticcacaulis excentricus]|uniref:FAD-dependent pyridine nucleotide-disulfide oxidoreductase n=1 Tax=Asticcacaulis excentricus (strain ATCC 15261 / DSM 4724 / KCTC 12464 / NCIMB 9791 / VKM B-1370 / CB 48) TaxID=573065 RepID=E8RQ85_ASTEC|nr:FAD-dependent oxidoreductase [Asticcacaulis excentricus]ADU13187.1 FAD-dependent pyridine nucleotide-disulfide oxidoreductase [Asticcacaulis excentricus CB 48]
MSAGVVIIGAGHAGGSAAAFLRQYGYEGPITLIGDEPHLPYQRPPLSKAWLKGEASGDDLYLRPQNFYDEANIAVWLERRVVAIDTQHKTVTIDGETIAYEHLIIATGSKARPFGCPGTDETPYHLLRTIVDAEWLKPHLKAGQRIGLIGAGYVGLEVAASARKLGSAVTVFERESRILARVASPVLSDAFTHIHGDNGVTLITGAEVVRVSAEGDLRCVHMADDSVHRFDVLLVGIGALPADDLAQAAGIACANGIVVNHEARTSVPDVFAIGDVTSREVKPWYEGRYRLESVPSALEQAKQAAAAITGFKAPPPEVPWFWSDQYDYKLQIAGLMRPGAKLITRGDPMTGAFSVFHLNTNQQVICVESVNRPADFMAGKQLIHKAVAVEDNVIADAESTLKPYLQAAR